MKLDIDVQRWILLEDFACICKKMFLLNGSRFHVNNPFFLCIIKVIRIKLPPPPLPMYRFWFVRENNDLRRVNIFTFLYSFCLKFYTYRCQKFKV